MKTNNEYQLLYNLRERYPDYAFEVKLTETSELIYLEVARVSLIQNRKLIIDLEPDNTKGFMDLEALTNYVVELVEKEPMLNE